MRAAGIVRQASLRREPAAFDVLGFASRKAAPVAAQKAWTAKASSAAAKPIYGRRELRSGIDSFIATNHCVVPVKPRQIALGHHRRGDEWSYRCSNSIEAMKKAEHFVGVGHRAEPCVQPGI